MENREFYVAVYYDGDCEKTEEFSTYTEAKEFYDNIEFNENYFKVLQKVVEWENGEEYIEVLEEE